MYDEKLVVAVRAAIAAGEYIRAAKLVIAAKSPMCFFCQRADSLPDRRILIAVDVQTGQKEVAELCVECAESRIYEDVRLNAALAPVIDAYSQWQDRKPAATEVMVRRITPVEAKKSVAVLVNGRLRSVIIVGVGATEAEVFQRATSAVRDFIAGKQYTTSEIPDKQINFKIS